MIRAYLDRALHHARYTAVDDGMFVAEVDGLPGVMATADTIERCREELCDVIEAWILVRVSRGLEIPPLDGVTLSVQRVA